MRCPFPSCLAVFLVCLQPASTGLQARAADPPGARGRPRVQTVIPGAHRPSARHVRWVDFHPPAPGSQAPADDVARPDLRGWIFSVGPWGFASYYVIPHYDGPRMQDGYGRSYDALGYRYGLEEEYFEQRYNPYYNAFGPLEVDPTGAVRYRRLRGSDVATPGRHLNLRDMNRRAERLLAAHERAYALGLEHLRRGNYTRAIASFTLAARLNQSDPAARLMLALARLAQGHHVEAAAAFRRAVELQPQLVYLELPLERHLPRRGLLRTFTGRLADWARSHPDQADVRYLLGYLWFRQGRLRDAYAVLQEAARLRPDDRLVRDLLEVARPPAGDAAQSRSE